MDRILIDHIRKAFREFLAFFYRHRIQICFAGSITDSSWRISKPRIERPVFNTFIKNYSWQMLLSVGYRFQQKVTQKFVDYLKTIEKDNDFYQTAIYISRRVKEYHFVDIDVELQKYIDRLKEIDGERRADSTYTDSLTDPSKNKALAPSVTITPTTIFVKPLKLAKTNRTIREPKFGGVFNFCLGSNKQFLSINVEFFVRYFSRNSRRNRRSSTSQLFRCTSMENRRISSLWL